MPMYQALAIFVALALACSIAAVFVERLRVDLLRPTFWILLLPSAGVISAASALIGRTRHAGTGFTTSHGWPKPFYFRYLSESGERSSGWEFIYFAGNSLVYVGALLMLWTIWRLARPYGPLARQRCRQVFPVRSTYAGRPLR